MPQPLSGRTPESSRDAEPKCSTALGVPPFEIR
jgi:hypothetical protein